MNIQTLRDYPARPADFLDRGTEMASRAAGVAGFALCISMLLYMVAF